MKGQPGPVPTLLRPILDTYMDSAVALVGCNSRGLGRYSCELDVLVVTGERRPATSIRIGDSFVDLTFATERDVLKPANPERAMSIATAKPVRDTSLILSTGSAASSAVFSESSKKASANRLASALKVLGRAEISLSKKDAVDADFWLLAATYEFAYALLLSMESLPSPSHLLAQLRGTSKANSGGFEGVSIGAGLDAAGRAGCGARLEGVTVLHDLLGAGSVSKTESEWVPVRTEILSAKAQELVTRVELAECYCFLGQELVDGIMSLLRRHPKHTLTSLTAGKDRLLGERLVRQLGLVRDGNSVRTGIGIVKEQVSSLARRE